MVFSNWSSRKFIWFHCNFQAFHALLFRENLNFNTAKLLNSLRSTLHNHMVSSTRWNYPVTFFAVQHKCFCSSYPFPRSFSAHYRKRLSNFLNEHICLLSCDRHFKIFIGASLSVLKTICTIVSTSYAIGFRYSTGKDSINLQYHIPANNIRIIMQIVFYL